MFIQACNPGDDLRRTTANFKVEDNQGNEFEPIELPRRNAFAYHPRVLGKDDCIPEAGSVAQLGPTAGSMLLFQFPLRNTENRPWNWSFGARWIPSASSWTCSGRAGLTSESPAEDEARGRCGRRAAGAVADQQHGHRDGRASPRVRRP